MHSGPWTNLVDEQENYWVYFDAYPVTDGHLLVVPKHENDITECLSAAHQLGENMVAVGECDGYNIGMNCGESAGQTIMWPHIHVIPRREGDMIDPTGGVRGVIPNQRNYKSCTYELPEQKNTGM